MKYHNFQEDKLEFIHDVTMAIAWIFVILTIVFLAWGLFFRTTAADVFDDIQTIRRAA